MPLSRMIRIRTVVLSCLLWTLIQAERFASKAQCGQCDTRRCPSVYEHNCLGHIEKDICGCCSVCVNGALPNDNNIQSTKESACEKVTCSKGQLCMLNIQGIPMCRCPSVFFCRKVTSGLSRNNPICGKDGITYPSRCHLRVSECSASTKIRVLHKGPCIVPTTTESKVQTRRRKIKDRQKSSRKGQAAKNFPHKIIKGDKQLRKEMRKESRKVHKQEMRSKRRQRRHH